MRELERDARARAVRFLGQQRDEGATLLDVARLLDVDRRTLATWEHSDVGALQPRGRPPRQGTAETRAEVLDFVLGVGLHVGAPVVHDVFDHEISRREVEAILRELRATLDPDVVDPPYVLTWPRAGAVWAADFTEPPSPIDGLYPLILVVRDLASGALLLALPVPEATCPAVAAALEALFTQHGAPLLLKTDNGSNLVGFDVQRLLGAWSVVLLRSPPRTPRYNGACEAGIGSIKTRAHHEAARQGRAGTWSCDDLEAARLQANELALPDRLGGLTPDQAWAARTPASQYERALFGEAVARCRAAVALERAHLPDHEHKRANIERDAIERALAERGLLSIRRRRQMST